MRTVRLVATLAGLVLSSATAASTGAYDQRMATLAERIEALPENASLARTWGRARARVERDPDAARARLAARLRVAELSLLRVPGLLYRTHPETGADLRGLSAWLGQPVALVETDELGTVEANAGVLEAALREGRRRSVLFSASKGSAEVRAALETTPALGGRVPIWIDLVGVLEGTPLLDEGVGPEDRTAWLPDDVARSLSARVRRGALDPERFPAATRAVHVAAFPAEHEVSERARESFAWLRALGPNDGYVMLDSYLRAPGRVLIERGVDHYFGAASALDVKLIALLEVLLDELPEGPPQGSGAGR